MAGSGNYASAALLIIVMIMVGAEVAAAAGTEVTAAAPSPTMEAGVASMAFVPSLLFVIVTSVILFLVSGFY